MHKRHTFVTETESLSVYNYMYLEGIPLQKSKYLLFLSLFPCKNQQTNRQNKHFSHSSSCFQHTRTPSRISGTLENPNMYFVFCTSLLSCVNMTLIMIPVSSQNQLIKVTVINQRKTIFNQAIFLCQVGKIPR